jgi:hypothetical protein
MTFANLWLCSLYSMVYLVLSQILESLNTVILHNSNFRSFVHAPCIPWCTYYIYVYMFT